MAIHEQAGLRTREHDEWQTGESRSSALLETR